MGQGISEVLPYAVGVALSPIPIIAVILMLFSQRARVNGPLFLLAWALALAVVSSVVYLFAHLSNPTTSSTASDGISWLKIALGLLLLVLAARQWRSRPAPGADPEMPKWLAGIDTLKPAKALGFGVLLAAVNPKNLILTIGAASGLAQFGLSTTDAIVSLSVFVVLGSITIIGPVVYYLVGGQQAKAKLDEVKGWLGLHNAAVMAVLFLVFGVDLIAKGIPPLTT